MFRTLIRKIRGYLSESSYYDRGDAARKYSSIDNRTAGKWAERTGQLGKPKNSGKRLPDKRLEFSAHVNRAAHRLGNERYPGSGRQVWIHDVHKAMGSPDRADFHSQLIDAHKRGKIELIRHDLAGHLSDADHAKRQRSEVTHGMATYHKVRV